MGARLASKTFVMVVDFLLTQRDLIVLLLLITGVINEITTICLDRQAYYKMITCVKHNNVILFCVKN